MRHCFLAVCSFVLLLAVSPAHAQRPIKGSGAATPPQRRVEIPADGPFHALVFFVQFRDDDVDGICSRGNEEWRSTTTRPTFADHLLAPTPTPPFADSSLTAFYYTQSRGNFTLYGDVFSYVTKLDEADYRRPDANPDRNELDRGKLAKEIFDYFNPIIDYSDYDANDDGYLDHAFFVLRLLSNLTIYYQGSTSGISDIGFEHKGSDYDGVYIHSGYSGSFNKYGRVNPQRGLVGLLAHEFGHDLWNSRGYIANHLPALSGNAVPYIAPPGFEPTARYRDASAYADRMVGYAHMVGAGSGTEKVTGGYLSAFERALVNLTENPDKRWIECDEMADGQTYELGDLFTEGDCRRIVLGGPDPVDELYVSNLQRASYFSKLDTVQSQISDACPGCHLLESGQPTTGLLVERTQRRFDTTLPLRYSSKRDIVPGDNALGGVGSCQGIIGVGSTREEHFAGDLWRPEERHQLSPWTRPNVYGYTFGADVPPAIRASGHHVLDDFRYAPGPASNRPIRFDYHRDALALDTFYVRDDSWMDAASDGLAFDGTVVVTAGATLYIGDGVDVTFEGGLIVEPGAQVVRGADTSLGFGTPTGATQGEGLTTSSARYPSSVSLAGHEGDGSRPTCVHGEVLDTAPASK